MTALKALIKRGIRSGLCSPDIPTLTEMAKSIDDALFQRIMYNPYHVIHHLLHARRELVYNIRQRHHDRQLTIVSGQLRNRNFIHHMLFEDCYWLYHIRRLRYVIEWLLSVSIDFYHCCLIDLYYADAFCHSVWYHMICVKQTYDITVSHRQLDNRPLIQLGSPIILSVFVLLSVRYFMRMDFFWQAIYLTNVLCCWNSIHRRIVDMQMMSILLQASTWPTPIKSVRARTTSRKWNSGAVERRSTVSSCRRWSAFSSELIIPMRSYVKSCRDGSIWPKLVSRSVPHTPRMHVTALSSNGSRLFII